MHALRQQWLLAAVLAASAMAAAAGEKDPIADYQADLSGGAVSASEMLGITPSAVTTIATPKDFVVALNTLSSGDDKASFGLAFTPARTRFAPVSIAAYRDSLGARAWAGTTFSYAQNVKDVGGTDYRQQAFAVRVAFYVHKEDDPAVAAHEGFERCTALVELAAFRTQRLIELRQSVRQAAVIAKEAITEEEVAERAKAQLLKEEPFAKKATPAYRACVDAAVTRATAKWNASQFALTLAEGRIRNAAAGSPRLSLGQSASLTLALAPNRDSLVNLTAKRTQKAVDLDTLGATPSYKSSSLIGARWTYRAVDTEDLYALAEISNAKASDTSTSGVFKYALGIDKRLSENMWIELRVGRNRTQDGKAEQTTALASLKFSPKSSLAP